MVISKEKINKILEYILIIALIFIGIKKGGYYKTDSLIGIYIIQLIALVFFIVNSKSIRKNKVLNFLFILFSLLYFLPIFFNSASFSGTMNFGIRMYSAYLVYLIVYNSKDKEKYLKAIAIFTVIVCLLGIDELGGRLLSKPLELLDTGYLDESNNLSSVIQYANIVGILCVISILYLLDKGTKEENSVLKKGILYLGMFLFTLTIFLTKSKMALLIYLLSSFVFCIYNKRRDEILPIAINTVFAILVSLAIEYANVYLIVFLALASYINIYFILSLDGIKKYRNIVLAVILFVLVIVLALNYKAVINSSFIQRIASYFENFESTKLRLVYYTDALKIITSSPLNFIFGVGGNGFRTLYETVQTTEYISLETHSLFMQIFVESGMLGLITFLAIVVYVLKNSKKSVEKLMLLSLLVFAAFDVFLTYTIMLMILVILCALFVSEEKQEESKVSIIEWIMLITVIVVTTCQVIALCVSNEKVDDLNLTLDEQQQVIQNCEIVLFLDPYDMQYLNNYNVALRNYLDIMDIKKELYGQDNLEKRKEIVSKIQNNTKNEMKYEKYNKYALEDNIFYTLKYLDYIVKKEYENDIMLGYENYLEYLIENIQKLELEHKYNDYSLNIYKEYIDTLKYKYNEINLLLNSRKIANILSSI